MEKWAMITGATGGMGRCYINEMIERGYSLVLVARNQEKIDKLVECLPNDLKYFFVVCDLTKEEDIHKVFQFIKKQNIVLDFLINVAGVEYEDWFVNQDELDIMSIIKVNVLATSLLVKKSLEVKNTELYVLNVSSMAGFFPIPMKAVYSSSKRYINELSRVLHYELFDHGVFVSCVSPAGMPTKEIIKNKIESQGFFGRCTTIDTKKVVRKSVDFTLKKKIIFVPGRLNRFLLRISFLIPRNSMMRILGRRWKKAHSKMKK